MSSWADEGDGGGDLAPLPDPIPFSSDGKGGGGVAVMGAPPGLPMEEEANGAGNGVDGLTAGMAGSTLDKEKTEDEGDIAGDKIALPSTSLDPEAESQETKIDKEVVGDTIYKSAKKFEDLPISKELLQGLYSEMGFERPSRIQAESLPLILSPPHSDLIAQAHNGSGKTTCFVLSMLSRVNPSVQKPQALCMCPTRELVIQNVQVSEKMGKYSGITVCHTASEQQRQHRREVIKDQVVIGTPGKIARWSTTPPKPLRLEEMAILVFDEADLMLETEGFKADSLKLIQKMRKSSRGLQVLLFSATFSEEVKNFAIKVCPQANRIFVQREKLSLEVIKQHRVTVPDQDTKALVLRKNIIPHVEKAGQMIIFVKSKRDARKLHADFEKDGFLVTSIHGDLFPEQRDRVIDEFRKGTTKMLIATDILSRGFDQANVNFVCNYDAPTTRSGLPNYETYLHRIGRSARFGRKGIAFNFIAGSRERAIVDDISRHYNKPIEEIRYDDEDGFIDALEAAGLA